MAARSTLITSQLPRAEWQVALGDPTAASEDVPHDLTDDVLVFPSQLLTVEALHHTYDRRLEDIFRVQDEIAAAIVSKLRTELAPQDQQLAVRDKAPTQNVEAYELYLQGRAIWKRRGEENLKRAIELYQRALSLDPGFARAHAALASTYVVLPGYTREEDDEATYQRLAEAAARQALSIDPNIGESHAVLAQLNAQRGDLLDAESGFFFAISLEPNEPTPHHWYSLLLGRVGRLQQALEQARRIRHLHHQHLGGEPGGDHERGRPARGRDSGPVCGHGRLPAAAGSAGPEAQILIQRTSLSTR